MRKELLRFVFVSVETVVWLAMGVLLVWFSDWIEKGASEVDVDWDKVKWIAAIPVALFAWVAKSSKSIQFQDADKNNILLDWPDYPKLECAMHAVFFHSVAFLCVSVAGAIIGRWNPPSAFAVVSILGGTLGLAICAASLWLADFRLAKAARLLNRTTKTPS